MQKFNYSRVMKVSGTVCFGIEEVLAESEIKQVII